MTEQGHGRHSRYRVIAELNLETEDGDCFPSEVANATCEALKEMFERLLDDKLAELGAVRVYDSVSVEHGVEQPVEPTRAAYVRAGVLPALVGEKA